MGLRSSKPKRSKDNTIINSVTNKHVQQTNKFREQTSGIRHLANKPGKQNNDFQIKKNKKESKKCPINASAEVTDESDTDNEDSTKIKTEETKASIQDLYKLPKTKQNNDKGFQTKKNKNKNKKCQMKESAQVTEESDTDKEDSTKIKTDETEAQWEDEESHQTNSLSDKWCDKEWLKTKKSSSSNIKNSHKWHEIKCLETKKYFISSDSRTLDETAESSPQERCKSSDNNEEQTTQGNIPFLLWRSPHAPLTPPPPLDELETCLDDDIEETGRRSSFTNIFMPLCMRSSPTLYKCHSSENNETQITRMDKIIAEWMIPHVPRRNRPATPPRDVLD